MKFRKKPVVIEAIRWLGNNWKEVYPLASQASHWAVDPTDNSITLGTLEGALKASLGDWIIRGIKGEVYSCKPDIFDLTYEPAP